MRAGQSKPGQRLGDALGSQGWARLGGHANGGPNAMGWQNALANEAADSWMLVGPSLLCHCAVRRQKDAKTKSERQRRWYQGAKRKARNTMQLCHVNY